MSSNPGERARLKALVAGERSSEAAGVRIHRLDGPVIEAAIRRRLHSRGGRAGRADSLADLDEEFHRLLGPLDVEMLRADA